MPSFKLPAEAFYQQDDNGKKVSAIRKKTFDAFNPQVLGLGDIQQDAIAKPAIAVLFDLQGFTIFCKQIEPQLSVPIYLSEFLKWIFTEIRRETIQKEFTEGVKVWHSLPFFTKFMGDGLLVLWDTSGMDKYGQHNLILSCSSIIRKYKKEFVPLIRKKVSDAPPLLRCGIAKGTVFSVGNGEDFVGSCINVAARLQKLATLSIAFARRGFDPEDHWGSDPALKKWVLKSVSIRGIGERELVYVRSEDFDKLEPKEKKMFSDP